MKNKDLHQKIADKTGYSLAHINYVINQMYKTVDKVIRELEFVNIKLPGFANIELSDTKINTLLDNYYEKEVDSKRDDEQFMIRYNKLHQAKKLIESHKKQYTKNRPKRFKG